MTTTNNTTGSISVTELLDAASTEAQGQIKAKTDKLNEKQILDKAVASEKKLVNAAEKLALKAAGNDDALLIFDIKTQSERKRLVIDIKFKPQYDALSKFDIELGSALGEAAADIVTDKVAPVTRTVASFFSKTKDNLFGEKKSK